ncbi:MAG TPA: hypothetical protein GXX40_05740 [Firmicutes bacterium]|nr:hypothetical protein [Bacillota bacterium]
MAYQKQTVLTGDLITADWGNYIQTQYEEALKDLEDSLCLFWMEVGA